MSKTITYDPNWQETYKLQVLTAAEAVKKIRRCQGVLIGTGTGEPLEVASGRVLRVMPVSLFSAAVPWSLVAWARPAPAFLAASPVPSPRPAPPAELTA